MTQKPPGRPKGRKNVRTILIEETAMKLGCDPFKILCLFAMNMWKELGYDTPVEVCESKGGESTFIKHTISPELRASCAKDACKYMYSQKQAVTVSGELGMKLIIEDYTKKEE